MNTNRRSLSRAACAFALGLLSATALSAPALAQGANVCANADVIVAIPSATAFDSSNPSDTPGVGATTTASSSCTSAAEVWFRFTPTESGTYDVGTCGSSFNTVMTVYTGPCGSLDEYICNDNFCGNRSRLQVGLFAGVDYHISIGSVNVVSPVRGPGQLNISKIDYPAAVGSVNAWQVAVGQGTPAAYVNDNIPGPTVLDVGLRAGATGATYEFIVNGTNAGFSSILMGALGTGVGSDAGLKFEQFDDLGEYGVTEYGVADYDFGGISNQEMIDLHLAFAVNTVTSTTELYVNGGAMGTVPSAPVLEGFQGIGRLFGPAGSVRDTFDGVIRGLAVYDSVLTSTEIATHSAAYFVGPIGTNYCGPSVPNSSGASSSILAEGSLSVSDNDFLVRAINMPNAVFGFFLASKTQGFSAGPGGSFGNLCVSGAVGRYVGPGEVQNSLGTGMIALNLDLTSIPQPLGFVSAVPGETWFFQAWHRDSQGGTAGSNFTDGIEILFQ